MKRMADLGPSQMRFVVQRSSHWPSESPMAAVSHLLSVCIAASPGKGDIGLPATRPEFLPKTLPVLVVRWPGSSPRLLPPRRHCCALVSMLPTERHSCRSGRTTHGTAVSYSAWHTHIAGVGVVVLFHWGFWPSPACPRTYLLISMIKARPLPSSALSCTVVRQKCICCHIIMRQCVHSGDVTRQVAESR